jgi:tRNA(Ile)-lysidine synthase
MFSSETLLQCLRAFPEVHHYWVAYSGGVDSHVLLHALAAVRARLPAALGAVHVNHGLHAAAADWGRHCDDVCRRLDVPLVELYADGRPDQGESPEAAARRARYTALRAWLTAGHGLLTAQHEDDQAETLLLQLLRGSGVRGLAAMPAVTPLGAGLLLRPLLEENRRTLLAYARANVLQWSEDPSNQDDRLDRNFLRHRILPELRRRWPALSDTVARSARHCAEAAVLLEQLASGDLRVCAGTRADTLVVTALRALSPGRQRNVLRHWLQARCGTPPSTAVLARIRHDMLASRADAGPCVRWSGFELRRYREHLFLLPQRGARDPDRRLSWSLEGALELPDGGGILRVKHTVGNGLRAAALGPNGVQVGYRQGGERCRPAGHGHHRRLKKLFQEAGVPPWERTHIPLIFVENQLAAVVGYWVCEPFSAAPGEPGLTIEWSGIQTAG